MALYFSITSTITGNKFEQDKSLLLPIGVKMMIKTNRKPTHPGAVFKEWFLDEAGLSVTEAADRLNMARPSLSNFINEKVSCSKEMARKLAESTDTGVSYWLNLQLKLDIWEAEHMETPKVAKISAA